MTQPHPFIPALYVASLFMVACAACARTQPVVSTPQVTVTGETAAVTLPAEQPSPMPPTSTPEALAVRVNEEGISVGFYQAELGRFQAAVGRELTPEDRQTVLNTLIDQALLAQAAAEKGLAPTPSELTERQTRLTSQLGGAEALQSWMQANGFSPESFQQSLGQSLAAAKMRDTIAAEVPQAAEQVHVIQILTDTPEKANEILAQLQAGQDFATLAAQADAITGGELGWFPRHYLTDSALEEAAFALEPKQFSPVVQTDLGYHILYLLEKTADRPLDANMRLVLAETALQDWLAHQREQSQIELLAP